jgi:hypothetical protein
MMSIDTNRDLAERTIQAIGRHADSASLDDWNDGVCAYGAYVHEGLRAGSNITEPVHHPDAVQNVFSKLGLQPPASGLLSDCCGVLWGALNRRRRERRMEGRRNWVAFCRERAFRH